MIVSGNNERFSENFFKLEIGLVCGFSLYGGKARLQGDFFSDGRISLIYSFLTEGDVTGDVLRCRQHLIAIHSLLTKGDSTISARINISCNFNPLPSHEGRPSLLLESNISTDISIHSLLTKGDLNLTSPVVTLVISIHSLLTKGDWRLCETVYKV